MKAYRNNKSCKNKMETDKWLENLEGLESTKLKEAQRLQEYFRGGNGESYTGDEWC